MPIKMKISEFVAKYGEELGVNYCAIHNLIKTGKLREGVHFRRSYRGVYEKFTVIPAPLYKFLKRGKDELYFWSAKNGVQLQSRGEHKDLGKP